MQYDRQFQLARTQTVASSLKSKITSAKSFNKTMTAQTASGNGVFTFADVAGIAVGMVVSVANLPAGATVQSINSGAHTCTVAPVTTGIVANGSSVNFSMPELAGLTALVDSAFAVSPTQTLINYHIAAPVGAILNQGNPTSLRNYANNLAAKLSVSTGSLHTINSAVAVGNRMEISMLVNI